MFEITVLQESLMVALEYLAPTIGNNNFNLGDDNVSLESNNNGSCVLYTTNTIETTEVEVICSNISSVGKAPNINFKRFKGIIASIPKTEYITLKEGINELLISFSGSKKPVAIKESSNPIVAKQNILTTPPSQMIELPVDFFREIINKSNSIIHNDSKTLITNCVNIVVDNPTITATAIDTTSKRTFMMTSDTGLCSTPVTFMIEVSKMVKSLKLFEDYEELEIGTDGNSILIRGATKQTNKKYKNASDDIVSVKYCTRQLNGIFPDVLKFYQAPYNPVEYITVNKKDMLNSISRIKAIGDDNSFNNGITITANQDEFNMSFVSVYGEISDKIDVYSGIKGNFNALFNHTEFEEILKSISSEYIDIGVMNGTTSNFIIRGGISDSGNYTGTDKFTMLSKALKKTP